MFKKMMLFRWGSGGAIGPLGGDFGLRGGGGKEEGELEKTENGKHKLQTPS